MILLVFLCVNTCNIINHNFYYNKYLSKCLEYLEFEGNGFIFLHCLKIVLLQEFFSFLSHRSDYTHVSNISALLFYFITHPSGDENNANDKLFCTHKLFAKGW